MKDIFDNTIICNGCNKPMKHSLISKNGFNLRCVLCENCGEVIVHPDDKIEYENFMKLKEKDFNVKMRMVGNSYAVSIPREIVDFMKVQEKTFDDMVKLSLDQLGKVSLLFNSHCPEENSKQRFVSAKEIRVIKNGKPVLHARKFSDSAHPERNQSKVFKAKGVEE